MTIKTKVKCECPGGNVAEVYAKQMAERHAFVVEKHFWMVVKQKPKWMPAWIYRAVIKSLVEFQTHLYK